MLANKQQQQHLQQQQQQLNLLHPVKGSPKPFIVLLLLLLLLLRCRLSQKTKSAPKCLKRKCCIRKLPSLFVRDV